ncbi:MAG: hypothetical protein KJZ69_13555 [Phycisphaerales bacterium]|nr:hypothetical protein [Phycisphaerales bacterium]
MTIRALLTCVLLSASLVVLLGASALQDPPSPPASPGSALPAPSLDERLAALAPENPAGYFLLGEEAMEEGQLEAAARLFVLAASLDGERFGRSACLALAEIEKRRGNGPRERDLRSLASLLGGSAVDVNDLRAAEREFRRAASLLSAMLGFYRQGDGQKALAALELNDATERLVVEFGRSIGSIGRIISFARNYPRCVSCRSERVIPCPTCRRGTVPGHCAACGGQAFIICNVCNGKPGEAVSQDEINAMLRFEVTLQSGEHASWSARLSVDTDRQRPVLDLTMLPRWYEVNTTLTVYRSGVWTVP